MADDNNGAKHLTDDTFADFLEEAGDTPVFVDFYADWCGPCKLAAPVVDKLAGEFEGDAHVVKLNVDENQKSAQEHQVMSIPTVIVFKNGEEQKRETGFRGEDRYRQLIENAVEA